MTAAIQVPRELLAEFCRQHGVRRLSFFGSVLTERFTPESDVDLLVEFSPGVRAGYLRMAAMENELGRLFDGRKVDLRTPAELSRHFRDEVMGSAALQYDSE